jgi:hypothetical protein
MLGTGSLAVVLNMLENARPLRSVDAAVRET